MYKVIIVEKFIIILMNDIRSNFSNIPVALAAYVYCGVDLPVANPVLKPRGLLNSSKVILSIK